jgi:hypothetical protein
MARELELIFTPDGVELVDKDTELVEWASDDDDDFRDSFTAEILTPDSDGEAIISWLTENDVISDDEAHDIEIYSEDDDSANEGEVFDAEEFDDT